LNLESRGVVQFHFDGKPDWDNRCFIFVSKNWIGDLRETEEMKPEWFQISKIPFKDMWEDDPIWVPDVLSGGTVNYKFFFTSTGKMINYDKIKEPFIDITDKIANPVTQLISLSSNSGGSCDLEGNCE